MSGGKKAVFYMEVFENPADHVDGCARTGRIFVYARLLLAAVAAVGAYVAYMKADIEYEYLYVDREISIDKVMAKSRRKKAASYSLEQMEIFAPLNSHRLDSYKNRQMKTADYSSGIAAQPERRYMMVWNGDTRVILEPNAEMIKAVQSVAPRKVFTD